MVVTGLLPPVTLYASEGEIVLLYFGWSTDLDDALDHLGTVGDLLGDESANKLELVKSSSDKYGVISRYNLSQSKSEALAVAHNQLLADSTDSADNLATTIRHESTKRVFNVSYGLGPNLGPLLESYQAVAGLLGAGVAKRLRIEKTSKGNFALVYKRYGDLESTRDIAKHHAKLMKRQHIDASFIQEKNNPVVFDGAMMSPIKEHSAPVANQPPTPKVALKTNSLSANAFDFSLNTGRTTLQDEINSYVKGLRKAGRVSSNEATSWMVYDLSNDKIIAAINGDSPRQAASMIKPFIALAFFSEAQKGRFIYGSKSKAKFEAMIQRSSNSSTNWVIDQVGGPKKVNTILTSRFPTIFKHTSIVEKIGKGGKTYLNSASASDYIRYLKALWADKLPYSAEQKRLLNLPGRDRVYNGAPHIPVGTTVYNKTGSTSRLCGDMGILVATKTNEQHLVYGFVGIIEKASRTSSYGRWIGARGNVIRGVSDLSYTYLQKAYGLKSI